MKIGVKALKASSPPAFTRVDLVATVGVVLMLFFVAGSALARIKPHSQRAYCANNLRQLGQALLMYAAENDGQFLARHSIHRWPTILLPGYQDTRLLRCPSDGPKTPLTAAHTDDPADNAPRSYLVNGCSDYYWALSHFYGWSPSVAVDNPPRLTDFDQAAATIAFGEKQNLSGHFVFDLGTYDDVLQLDQNRHDRSAQDPLEGGSNHAFVDGSVRYLKYWSALAPTNLWAVTALLRTNLPAKP